MKKFTAILAGAMLAGLSATAAGAVEVRQVTEILAPPAKVWARIGDWCAIKTWHPAIANCASDKPGYRTLTLKDGGRIVEKQTKTGPTSYSYDIIDSPLPVKNYSATLSAKRDSNGNTDLTWTAKFDAANGKTEAEAEAAIKGIFEAGLKNIKSTVKFDGPGAAAAAATGAAATATAAAAATAASDAKAKKEAERAKAKEERQKRIAELKAKAAEKYAAAKLAVAERYAKAKAYAAEKAKAAYDAAKSAYDKAKTMTSSDGAKPKTP